MSKTLKIVLGVIFTFTAIIYLVNIGAKSFEDANSTGRLISHLVIGVLVGGLIVLGLLQAESQQHITANRWVTVKLNDHFNAIFITGIVSISAVVISKSAHEVTKSSWYLANEISNNAVAICDEYESSAQVEKSNDKLIKLARAHLSSPEIFLMACENALYENEFNEIYSLKRALTDIELGNIKRGFAVIVRLTEQTNQEKLLKKLVSYNYLTEAEEVAELFDDAKIKASMLNLVAEKYFKNSDYVQAERLFSSLRDDNYYYGYRGLRKVYDKTGKPEKSLKLYRQLYYFERKSDLDTSNTSAWLAYYYDNGLGGVKDLVLARAYYEEGLSSLSEGGKKRLAEMYYKGIGGDVRKQEAIELGYVTPEMKKIKDIKNGKGVIVRGSYMCELFNSVQRLIELEKAYGSLQYIAGALPRDCFDLVTQLDSTYRQLGESGISEIAITEVVQEKNEFIQFRMKGSKHTPWIGLNHVKIN
ncbi:hypothetical protein NQU96_12590 [Pseudoalteromonas elyakovii]|nr:hypothetical protein [Pseudoalteromonas elyakovii]